MALLRRLAVRECARSFCLAPRGNSNATATIATLSLPGKGRKAPAEPPATLVAGVRQRRRCGSAASVVPPTPPSAGTAGLSAGEGSTVEIVGGKKFYRERLLDGEEEVLTEEEKQQKDEIVKELTRRLSGPLADEHGNVPTGKDRPVAIEVDGPSHFYANSKRYTAYTKLKHRLLTRMGYKVLHVPYFEWRRLRGAKEREEYMRAKLLEEPTEWLDPEDEKYYNSPPEEDEEEFSVAPEPPPTPPPPPRAGAKAPHGGPAAATASSASAPPATPPPPPSKQRATASTQAAAEATEAPPRPSPRMPPAPPPPSQSPEARRERADRPRAPPPPGARGAAGGPGAGAGEEPDSVVECLRFPAFPPPPPHK